MTETLRIRADVPATPGVDFLFGLTGRLLAERDGPSPIRVVEGPADLEWRRVTDLPPDSFRIESGESAEADKQKIKGVPDNE